MPGQTGVAGVRAGERDRLDGAAWTAGATRPGLALGDDEPGFSAEDGMFGILAPEGGWPDGVTVHAGASDVVAGDARAADAVAARRTAPATPLSWRVTALALVAGGMLAGDVAARRVGRRGGLALLGLGLPALTLPLLVGERRWHGTPRTAPPEAPRPSISVVIAARDEARVVGRLLGDLARQDFREPDGRPCFEVVLIDDRSTDGTADAAREAAASGGLGRVLRVVARRGDDLADGKGAALMAAPPEHLRGEVVVVLDADARVGPEFLRRLAEQMLSGAAALSCPIEIAGEGMLARAQAAEQRLDVAIQRARFATGGASEFRGNGIVVRRDVLAAAGGWRAVLTEDLDLSSRIALLGHRVDVARDVRIGAEPVPGLQPLWTQRLRWAEGALRRAFEHAPAVLATTRLEAGARTDFALYVGQLTMPGVILGAAVGGARRRRPAALLAITATWGLMLSIVGRSPLAAATTAVWIGAVPAAALRLAFRRGPVRYAKMEHVGAEREQRR